jgi:hypothetical protein
MPSFGGLQQRLECLILPQECKPGEEVEVPIESFFCYRRQIFPTLADFQGAFSQLRCLELTIDTNTYHSRGQRYRDLLYTGFFASTIRCMHEIHTLRLAFVNNDVFGRGDFDFRIQDAFGIFEIEELLDTFSRTGTASVSPNPWPELKHLALFGLRSKCEEYLILFNTISSTLSTLDLQGVCLETELGLTEEWARLVDGMGRRLSNLQTLTLRPALQDGLTLVGQRSPDGIRTTEMQSLGGTGRAHTPWSRESFTLWPRLTTCEVQP